MLAAVEDVARPPSADMLLQRIEQLEERGDESSRRFHLEIEELRRRFDALPSRPLEVDNIRFPPRMVVAIVAAVLTIVGGMYASTYGLRSDVRDILTKQENRDRLDEVNQKLSDQKSEALTRAVDMIDKRQQLQAIEIQELKEMVLRQGVTK